MTARRVAVRLLQVMRLNRIAHRVYYAHLHGFDAATRATLVGLDRAFAAAQALGTLGRGDYYEFGLFKGYSFWWAQKTARSYEARSMRFFGFDSFEGLPEVVGRDRTGRGEFYRGQYAWPYQRVRAALSRQGVDWSRTFLIRGFYRDSLTGAVRDEYRMGPVAIALVDCDLYASTVDVLRFLAPLLVDRSILILDDWDCFGGDAERGQRKALAEFVERRPEVRAEELFGYGSWGRAFALRMRAG